jgi:hypothetical protein
MTLRCIRPSVANDNNWDSPPWIAADAKGATSRLRAAISVCAVSLCY